MDAFELKQLLIEASKIGAAEVLKTQAPASDELSEKQAAEFAGRTWIKQNVLEGKLKFHRVGPAKNSKKIFSRAEIMALKSSERLNIILR